MERKTRSGHSFSPYNHFDVPVQDLESVAVPVEFNDLVELALTLEKTRLDTLADDTEGIALTSKPTTRPPRKPINKRTRALPSTSPAALHGGIEKRRHADYRKTNRHSRHIAMAQSGASAENYRPRRSTVQAQNDVPVINAFVDAKELPTTQSGAWIGQHHEPTGQPPPSVGELLKDGFTYVKWDGRQTKHIIDHQSRIIVALVGRPPGADWDHAIYEVTDKMEDVQERGEDMDAFGEGVESSRRGEFVALPTGVSFGGGQKIPRNLTHPPACEELIEELLADENIIRIAGFQSSAFAATAPKLYVYYTETSKLLFNHHPNLRRNFTNSIFAATSFNCGPRTISFRHFDSNNLSFGMCALTALGRYNPRLGGHLILYNLKLVIEFPPGSTILLPSAAVEHGNTPVSPEETRLSIAQYTSGGLFRWVAYGFRTVKSLTSKKKKQKQKDQLRREFDLGEGERWGRGIDMFSKLGDLEKDRQSLLSVARAS
ncbi:hypothetical protein Hypma_008140 [Hypsizygus marmoreus]|uniref:Uncharacterized protein n=1 Tax=Hypsizygus marmoreus TaxID=39966 RepID=A0A369JV68_HYPMA|nr:hypothetical protein Hypma_008140 [Hypsizygus marmoreus]